MTIVKKISLVVIPAQAGIQLTGEAHCTALVRFESDRRHVAASPRNDSEYSLRNSKQQIVKTLFVSRQRLVFNTVDQHGAFVDQQP